MKNVIIYLTLLSVMAYGAIATDICPNQGFECECQNYYGSMDYTAIAKFYMDDSGWVLDEMNPAYDQYEIEISGDLKEASWTSNYNVYSVLVKAGNQRAEFDGGLSGDVQSDKDISHLTFCKMKSSNGGGNGNGVPEYSTVALGAAVIMVSLGLVFLRKR